MQGTNNFKIFNESLTNIEDDATYLSDTQRVNGVAPGQARTTLHNKLFRQVSIMGAALGQFIANQGYNASDADLNNLITAIGNTFATTKNLSDAINGIPASPITSVNSKTGAVMLSASDINTSSGTSIETQLADMTTLLNTKASNAALTELKQYTTLKSGKDANGIFVTYQRKRYDGTLLMQSVLSDGTSPQYTTRTETWYATDGTTVVSNRVYTITYDADGAVVSEV